MSIRQEGFWQPRRTANLRIDARDWRARWSFPVLRFQISELRRVTMIRNLLFGSGRVVLLTAAVGALTFANPNEASARRRCCCRVVYYQPACPAGQADFAPGPNGAQTMYYRGQAPNGFDAQGNPIGQPGAGAELRYQENAPSAAPAPRANGRSEPPPAPERPAPSNGRRDPNRDQSAPPAPPAPPATPAPEQDRSSNND